jgi:hypothetical protein
MNIDKRFGSRILLASLVAVLAGICNASRAEDLAQSRLRRVEGFEGYKFGMTLDEALAVRPTAKTTQCDYKGIAACIEYQTTLSAFSASVAVQFRKAAPLLLSRILVRIRSFGEPNDPRCYEAGREILKLLVAKYGSEPFIKDRTATWASAEGGAVSLLTLCANEDKGINIITYEPSSAL